MYAAAIVPFRCGSSEKDSNPRPPKGDRCVFTVGARRMCEPGICSIRQRGFLALEKKRTFGTTFIAKGLPNLFREIEVKRGTEARGGREAARGYSVEDWVDVLGYSTVRLEDSYDLHRVPRTPLGPELRIRGSSCGHRCWPYRRSYA